MSIVVGAIATTLRVAVGWQPMGYRLVAYAPRLLSYLLRFDCQLYRGREIQGERRFKGFPFTCPRMPEPKSPRMQHLAREILCKSLGIDFIAENGMAEMMKMHADLVSASAMQTAFD
jgi:hypothetical protein